MPYKATRHVLSRCVVIPNKFPTLLAEREIIANAFYKFGFLPELRAKIRNKSKTTKEKRKFL